jgi:CheY-like chemotaxis protein
VDRARIQRPPRCVTLRPTTRSIMQPPAFHPMNSCLPPGIRRIPDTEDPCAATDRPDDSPESPGPGRHRIRILHADDDRTILRASQILLGRAGYDVDTVADGEEAWGALQAVPYDLVITDNQMPHLTGVELIQRLRRSLNPVPIVLASASIPRTAFARCEAVLAKPFTVRDLIETVRRVLLGSRCTSLPRGALPAGTQRWVD